MSVDPSDEETRFTDSEEEFLYFNPRPWREARTRRDRQIAEIRRMYNDLAGYILEHVDSSRLMEESGTRDRTTETVREDTTASAPGDSTAHASELTQSGIAASTAVTPREDSENSTAVSTAEQQTASLVELESSV